MKLIDKQKALDALMAERKYLIARGQESAEHVLTHHAYNIIDEQPIVESRPKSKWIPCSERLPDEKGEYLLTLEMMDGTYECDMDRFNGKKWDYYHKGEVVAWLPLPEPYRGDDK